MRVNVDSQAMGEPRIRRMARRLGITHYEVLGRLTHIWMVCYERRDEFLDILDGEVAAGELDGFVDAMVREGLADLVDEKTVRVRGVSKRIDFLERQAEKGRKSGARRREVSDGLQKRASVQPGFEFGSTAGSTNPRTYSPDHALDHALDQDPDRQHVQLAASPLAPPQRNGPGNSDVLPVAETRRQDTPPAPETPYGANGEPVGRAKRQVPEPQPEALTLANLLLHCVETNHPGGRLAHAAPRLRDQTALRWAQTIDKLHRLDGIQWGAINGMIEWCQRDSFWRTCILGADTLRDKWDTMAAQRSRPQGQGQRNEQRPGPTELAKRDVAELERAAKAKAVP